MGEEERHQFAVCCLSNIAQTVVFCKGQAKSFAAPPSRIASWFRFSTTERVEGASQRRAGLACEGKLKYLKLQMVAETDNARQGVTGLPPGLGLGQAVQGFMFGRRRRSIHSSLAAWLVTSVLAGLFASPAAYALGRNYEVQQLAPHTFVWVPDDIMDQNGDPIFNRAGNVGFVITPAGVVVINTANNPFHAREVLYEIRQRTDLPVRLVVDLGAQGDEMLGNEVFAEQHADIVSTSIAETQMQAYRQNLARRITLDPQLPTRMRGIHFTLPGQTFQGQTSFNLGGAEIRVIALNCGLPGAAAGDAVVYLPQEKVLFLGDLYVKKFVPQVGSRDIQRWIKVLGEVGKWDVVAYVPGHGEPGTKSNLAGFRGFLEWLDAGVQTGVQQGKSLSEVEEQLLSSTAFNLLALDLAPRAIADVYHQVMSARSARALPSSVFHPLVPQSHPSALPGNGARGFVGTKPSAPH
jgi:glyoxylase-like metal-dependent hydrolase (beta-lactamase superfamily II)